MQPPNGRSKQYFDNNSLGLSAAYELDLWGRVRNSVRAGDASLDAAAAALESARPTLQAALVDDYVQLRRYAIETQPPQASPTAHPQPPAQTQTRNDRRHPRSRIRASQPAGRAGRRLRAAASLRHRNAAAAGQRRRVSKGAGTDADPTRRRHRVRPRRRACAHAVADRQGAGVDHRRAAHAARTRDRRVDRRIAVELHDRAEHPDAGAADASPGAAGPTPSPPPTPP